MDSFFGVPDIRKGEDGGERRPPDGWLLAGRLLFTAIVEVAAAGVGGEAEMLSLMVLDDSSVISIEVDKKKLTMTMG